MKICIFDWSNGGHNSSYVQAFVGVLASRAEVVVAAPDPIVAEVRRFEVETHSLGAPRPLPNQARGLDKATLARREIDLLQQVVGATAPDHLLLPYADPILRWLATTPPLPCKVSVLSMFSSAHAPRAYELRQTPKERLSAHFKEWNIQRWRRRDDASVIFGLDPAAVELWSGRRGAPACWLPEPPLLVSPIRRPADQKQGCLLFGALDRRKGIGAIADALSEDCEGFELAIYGTLKEDFRDEFNRAVSLLEASGVNLELRLDATYEQAMEKMSRSRCALLSFAWKPPAASRVLLEASTAGTPVVTGAESAVARIVERNGLGLVADPADPVALRRAILGITADPEAPAHYEDALRRYAESMDAERFSDAVLNAFGLG